MTSTKVSIENVNQFTRKLKWVVEGDVVTNAFQRVYSEIRKTAHLKGFRPGKAPLQTIKSLYGSTATRDVVEEIVGSAYTAALREHRLNPVGDPQFDFGTPVEGQMFEFSATVEVTPEVKLKKVEGLSVKKETYQFKPEKLEETIRNIRKSNSSWEPVLELRPAQMGDRAKINFSGFVDNEPLKNGDGTGFLLELGSRQFIEGFEEGVVGMKVGDHKELHLKFPEAYGEASIAGKPVLFKVELMELQKEILPEFDGALLEKLGMTDKSVEDFKKLIQEDIENSEKKRIEDEYRENLMSKLVEENPIQLPPGLVAKQKKMMIDQARKKWIEEGQDKEKFVDYAMKWDEDFTKSAIRVLSATLLIREIAEQKSFFPTDADMDARLDSYAQKTGIERSRLDVYYKDPENRDRLASQMTEERVFEYLGQNAKN